jgi:hypothetical protein
VGVDGVDLVLGLEDVLHNRQAFVRVEVARLLGDDFDAPVRTALFQLFLEPFGPFLGDRDPGQPLDFDDFALAIQLFADVFGRQNPDLAVVAEDRRRGRVGLGEEAVDVDHRDPGVLGFLRNRRQRFSVLRQNHQDVGFFRDHLLDLLRLRIGVGRLEQFEIDVVVFVCLLLRVLGNRAEPAVVGRRHAGDDAHGLTRAAARTAFPCGRSTTTATATFDGHRLGIAAAAG